MEYYLAFDPGTNTGWARFNDQGINILHGVCKGNDELLNFLEKIPEVFGGEPAEIIYEDYRLNPAIRQGGKRPVAGIAIGYIESYAKRKKIPFTKSRPANLAIGITWAGLKKPRGHLPDWMSAIAHGTYILQSKGIRKSNLQLKIEAEREQDESGRT